VSELKVQIVADGVTREFSGTGDGPELVACFRAWLASSEVALPMAAGADLVSHAAGALVQASVPPRQRSLAPRVPKPQFDPLPADCSTAVATLVETATVEGARLEAIGRRLMDEAFFPNSGEYNLHRLAFCVRGETVDTLALALDRLVERKQVAMRTMRGERRWSRAS
jgi:hypothetical protein